MWYKLTDENIMKDSAWVRLIIIIIKFTMNYLRLMLKNIYIFKKAKTTRQRFTHSASSGLFIIIL